MRYEPTAKDKAYLEQRQKLLTEITRLKREVNYWKIQTQNALEKVAELEQLYADTLEHSALTPEQLTQHMKDTAKAAGLADMLKCMKGW